MGKIIRLPYDFTFRPYQLDVFRARFVEKKDRFMSIWHRRSGKTKGSLNFLIAASQERVGTYYHSFPLLTQARRVIWQGMGKDGRRYLDDIPPQLIKAINKSDMRIELTNGSAIQLVGSDNYDSLVGGNPIGIIFDEFSLQNPLAWDYFRPILAENGGWGNFIFTPRGKNHAYDLYEVVKSNPAWHVSRLRCDQTLDWDGKRIVTDEMVAKEREDGMSEERIQQEFYVSFDSGVEGAYYAAELKYLNQMGHIYDFEIQTNEPVYTFWDIGCSDATAIWFMQKHGSALRMIHYVEANHKGVDYWANYIRNYQQSHGITYGTHFGPHDLAHKKWEINGKTVLSIAFEAGLQFQIVPKGSIVDGIEAARKVFPRVHFHKTNCHQGLRCLQEYHAAYDENHQIFRSKPVHNWASHGADAFRYFAVQWNPQMHAIIPPAGNHSLERVIS